MSSAGITAEEMAESLTGYDEIAIEKHMGIDIYQDAETKGVKALRSLVFVALTRDGIDPKAAKEQVMQMSLKDANDYFAEEPEEVEPDQPFTEAGKDDVQPD